MSRVSGNSRESPTLKGVVVSQGGMTGRNGDTAAGPSVPRPDSSSRDIAEKKVGQVAKAGAQEAR